MSRLRFATANAVFESFPELHGHVGVPPTDDEPLAFLRMLSFDAKFENAASFCAFVLPRRECVWWACRSVRTLLGDIVPQQVPPLRAAEAWVRDPSTELRQAALDVGTKADANTATAWCALAAGWSGGILATTQEGTVQVPSYMTPRAARLAVIFSAAHAKADTRDATTKTCIEDGIKLAENGV
jgi:hypothetical protein